MEYLIAGLVGYIVGYWFRGIMVLYRLSREPETMIKLLEQVRDINQAEAEGKSVDVVKVTGVELAIERVNDRLYAYSKDTNQFIAQGTDLKDLLAEAHKRFPGKTFFGDLPEDISTKELA